MIFQSTRPIRGATPCFRRGLRSSCHFNPRAPYGARLAIRRIQTRIVPFQSTRPIRGATTASYPIIQIVSISIHAPHTGRDSLRMLQAYMTSYFNPRAPYGARRDRSQRRTGTQNFNPRAPYGARPAVSWLTVLFHVFQSTRPIRGATLFCSCHSSDKRNFNPRAPYGARRKGYGNSRKGQKFQSTRPIRGATRET